MKIFLTDKAYKEALFERDEKVRFYDNLDRVLSENMEFKERIKILEERMDYVDSFRGKTEDRREP